MFIGKPIGQFSAQLFQLAWLAQLIFAVQIARTNQKQLKGEIQAPQPISNFRKPITKLSGTQASEYYSKELAKGQLQSGEHIIKSFIGKKHVSLGKTAIAGVAANFASSWHCVALTQSTLILIELDFLWKPSNVKRFPCSDIVNAHYKIGWLNTDKISLDFGNGKVLDLDIAHTYRKSAQAVVSVFEKL